MNELKAWASEMLFLLKMRLRLKMAIKMAEYKHFITSKRYWVLPTATGGLMVLCNDEFTFQKSKGNIKKHDGYVELSRKAFFMTATQRGGKDAPSWEQRQEMRLKFDRYSRTVSKMKLRIGTPVA